MLKFAIFFVLTHSCKKIPVAQKKLKKFVVFQEVKQSREIYAVVVPVGHYVIFDNDNLLKGVVYAQK